MEEKRRLLICVETNGTAADSREERNEIYESPEAVSNRLLFYGAAVILSKFVKLVVVVVVVCNT